MGRAYDQYGEPVYWDDDPPVNPILLPPEVNPAPGTCLRCGEDTEKDPDLDAFPNYCARCFRVRQIEAQAARDKAK